MKDLNMYRKPTVIANWKMAMKIDQSKSFIHDFKRKCNDLMGDVQIILCAPATILSTLSELVKDIPYVYAGAQNSSAYQSIEHSGEISAELLADTGCNFCMVGHWDMKVRMNKKDEEINQELHNVLNSGMRPIILVGESKTEKNCPSDDLHERMETVLQGISSKKIENAVMVYEPEWAIGAKEPASPQYIAERATFIRNWLSERYNETVSQSIPIVYGGSVFPENAEWLLSTKDIDGLGAGRKSRNPEDFFHIVKKVLTYGKSA